MSIPRNTSRSTGRARESDAGINRPLPELLWHSLLEDVSAERKTWSHASYWVRVDRRSSISALTDYDSAKWNGLCPFSLGRLDETRHLRLALMSRGFEASHRIMRRLSQGPCLSMQVRDARLHLIWRTPKDLAAWGVKRSSFEICSNVAKSKPVLSNFGRGFDGSPGSDVDFPDCGRGR
jgi:hypothetical protein